MKLNYFDTTKLANLKDLRNEYLRLTKIYHPDVGGTTEAMQKVNAEYDYLTKHFVEGMPLNNEERATELNISETYKELIGKLVQYPGLVIELVGTWIWVRGNTYPFREALGKKGLGFKFSGKHSAWYFHEDEFRSKKSNMNLEQIRKKYGSVAFDNITTKAISGIADIISLMQRLKLLLAARSEGIAGVFGIELNKKAPMENNLLCVKAFYLEPRQEWIYTLNGKAFLRSVHKLEAKHLIDWLQKNNSEIAGMSKAQRVKLIVQHYARTLATKATSKAGTKLNQWRWHGTINGAAEENEVTKIPAQ